MLAKKDIVNFLFVISFPVYGLGSYVTGYISPSIGSIVSVVPLVLILIFFFIDSLYKRSLNFGGGSLYLIATLLLLLCCYSLYVAYKNQIPFYSRWVMIGNIALTIIPYNAFIPVLLYNGTDVKKVIRLTFVGISILLMLNLVGFYGLGIANAVHSIEGRINFPFIDSFYSGSALAIVISLMLLFYMKRLRAEPIKFMGMLLYLFLNLAIIFMINSRLQVLIFLVTILVFTFGPGAKSKFVFFTSLFFVPLLLNFSLLVYKILSLPAMEAILVRVSKEDVTTFHGRAQLWQAAIDWLINDQTGIWFGNGYKGHVLLHLLDFEAKVRWHVPTYNMHLHSTAFELLTSTGVVGYALFVVMMYKTFLYFRQRYADETPEAIFMPIMFFLIWVLQIDLIVYLGSWGNIILSLMWAMVTVGASRKKAGLEIPVSLKVTPGMDNGARRESVNQY